MLQFLETCLYDKFKNKLILIINVSCHKNNKVKQLINNNLLYVVLYHTIRILLKNILLS